MLYPIVVAVALWSGTGGHAVDAEPGVKVRVGGIVSNESIGLDQFDHALFDSLLCRFVDTHGYVCYRGWKHDADAMHALHAYLCSLGAVDLSQPASRDAELAFYINAYNALVIWGILQEYPTVSIQQHNRKGADYRIFDDLEIWLGGEYLSLNQIENDRLRVLGDYRIHFALVCAAKGCPRLLNRAYSASTVDSQLTLNAMEFFACPTHFRLCKLTGCVKVSPILKWYREDFGETDAEVLATIYPHLPAEAQKYIACHPQTCVKYLGYDWGLNDRCPGPHLALGGFAYTAYAKVSPVLQSVRAVLPARNDTVAATFPPEDSVVADPEPASETAVETDEVLQEAVAIAPPRALNPRLEIEEPYPTPEPPRALHPREAGSPAPSTGIESLRGSRIVKRRTLP